MLHLKVFDSYKDEEANTLRSVCPHVVQRLKVSKLLFSVSLNSLISHRCAAEVASHIKC